MFKSRRFNLQSLSFWKKHYIIWLGTVCLGSSSIVLADTPPNAEDNNHTADAHGVLCAGAVGHCQIQDHDAASVTSDWTHQTQNAPFYAALPDENPSGVTSPARFYSFAKDSDADSVPPVVTCSAATGGTPTQETRSTFVTLNDGDSCAITVTPQSNSDPYSDVVYTGTLSRDGAVYKLTHGEICGGPYTCATASNASVASVTGLASLGVLLGAIGIGFARRNRYTAS